MDKQTKKVYEAPALTAVSFKMERGYAFSDPLTLFGLWDGNSSHDAYGDGVEDFTYDTDNGGYWNW